VVTSVEVLRKRRRASEAGKRCKGDGGGVWCPFIGSGRARRGGIEDADGQWWWGFKTSGYKEKNGEGS
jgi:hypothetical protein